MTAPPNQGQIFQLLIRPFLPSADRYARNLLNILSDGGTGWPIVGCIPEQIRLGCWFEQMRRHKLILALAMLLVVITAAVMIGLRRRSAPEAARLLPEAEAVVYLNLGIVRRAGVLEHMPPVTHDTDYEQFVRETGFQLERDLDQAAFAVHAFRPPENSGAATIPAESAYPRFSEVFVGRFDSARLTAYLRKLAGNIEPYREIEIFSIPHEGRMVRVAVLGAHAVAVSNVPDPGVIRGIIDRKKQSALLFGGPRLLRDYYANIPLASLAWGIGKIASANSGSGLSVGGWLLSLPGDVVVVASARYLGNVQVRLEAFAGSEDVARHIAEQANVLLNIFRGVEVNTPAGGSDQDVKAFFASLKIDQEKDRAVVTATVPPGFFKKVLAEPPSQIAMPGVDTKKASPPGKHLKGAKR